MKTHNKGALGTRLRSNFCFIFMQFLGKIGQNNRFSSSALRLALPPQSPGNPGSATVQRLWNEAAVI